MLVECVPNFSEGRDAAKIERLCAAARSVPGAALLDVHRDPDHNRCVLTLAGAPAAVSEAAFRAAAVVVEALDLRAHQGVHPRIGAVDVVPFVLLAGATQSDCVALAEALGARLADELALPVYLYAHAARRPERRRLPWLRAPGYEGLAAALATPERAPDLGPARPHPTAGAVAVGARDLLVAFNVDLASADLKLARRIARALRESSGGLPGVQARGLPLAAQGRVQVSMNLLDASRVGPARVYAEVATRAAAAGVEVARSELVGLLPRACALEAAQALLRLEGPPLAERLLEARVEQALLAPAGPLRTTLAQVAAPGPFDPGGGTATALGLALGRACFDKALALARGGKGALEDAALDALAAPLASAEALLELARVDHAAFAGFMGALRRPRGDAGRKAALEAARGPAVDVPRRILFAARDLAEAAARLARDGNPHLKNDALAAAELALAAGRVAAKNAQANRKGGAPAPDEVAALDVLAAAAEGAREAAG